ncbi:GNAT family N-acetyltransferase [Cuniculiplasma sp. SKW3]|uniref:GNAT family N-acetyltransferase n=1 Tax=unclassified Cuniculiplasma TaxID=2619706 RepID=UPI003FD00AAB
MLGTNSAEINYEIRLAKPSDASGIIRCMQSVMDEKIYLVGDVYFYTEKGQKDLIKNPDDLNIVAESNGEIVGMMTIQRGIFRKNRHTATMGIAIMNGYRHIGIGRKMISEGIEWCKQQNIRKLNLEVFSSNENAISLYKKMGFEVEGVRKNQFLIFDRYVDDILMSINFQ